MMINGWHASWNVLWLVSLTSNLSTFKLVHYIGILFIELHDFVVELFRFVRSSALFGSLAGSRFESVFAYQSSWTFVGDQMIRRSATLTIYFISVYLECWFLDTFLFDALFELMFLCKMLHEPVSLRRINATYQGCYSSVRFLLIDHISLFCLPHIPRLVERRSSNQILLDRRLWLFPVLSSWYQKNSISILLIFLGFAVAFERFIFLNVFLFDLQRICIL